MNTCAGLSRPLVRNPKQTRPPNFFGAHSTDPSELLWQTGCCGDKELIKFEAFLLTEHPVVILMDMDMLVLKPLDDVVDLILHNNPHPEIAMRHLQNTSGSDGSNVATGDIWLLYVHDYFMTKPPYLVNPSQGGFAILKPNRSIYSEIQQIVLKGDFHDSLGWGNATGTFWGSMTFQGLLPYYFQVLHPGHALALDWCRHDYMHMPPTTFISSGNETVERCLAPNCQDCLDTAFEDVHTVHLTLCDKPWMCENYDWKSDRCKAMQRAWFQYRSELERSWGRSGRGSSNQTNEHLLGYCSKWGAGGYEAIRQPYGVPV